MIEIKTDMVLRRGEPMRKILAIKALTMNELPDKYTRSKPYCYAERYGGQQMLVVRTQDRDYTITTNSLITNKRFVTVILRDIAKCGDRLHDINIRFMSLKRYGKARRPSIFK